MDISKKIENKNYQVRQILATFSNLIALMLGWNSVKSIKVTKIAKEIKFEGVLGQVKIRSRFPETFRKIFFCSLSLY